MHHKKKYQEIRSWKCVIALKHKVLYLLDQWSQFFLQLASTIANSPHIWWIMRLTPGSTQKYPVGYGQTLFFNLLSFESLFDYFTQSVESSWTIPLWTLWMNAYWTLVWVDATGWAICTGTTTNPCSFPITWVYV